MFEPLAVSNIPTMSDYCRNRLIVNAYPGKPTAPQCTIVTRALGLGPLAELIDSGYRKWILAQDQDDD